MAEANQKELWLKRNRWEIGAVFVVIIIGLLLLRAVGLSKSLIAPPWGSTAPVVVATTDLLPYHIISAADVKLEAKGVSRGSYTDSDDVIGHYLLSTVSSGDVLLPDQLSQSKLSEQALNDRKIVIIPLKTDTFFEAIPLGSTASLLFPAYQAEETTPTPLLIEDVIILDKTDHEAGGVIVVGMKEADFALAVPYLGQSDLIVVPDTP